MEASPTTQGLANQLAFYAVLAQRKVCHPTKVRDWGPNPQCGANTQPTDKALAYETGRWDARGRDCVLCTNGGMVDAVGSNPTDLSCEFESHFVHQ